MCPHKLKNPLCLCERALTQSILKHRKPVWPWAFPNRQYTESQHQCYWLLPTPRTVPHILPPEVKAQVPRLPFHQLEPGNPSLVLPKLIRGPISTTGGWSEATSPSEVLWRVSLIWTFNLVLDVTINNKCCLCCLIDTGAQISVINRSHTGGDHFPHTAVVCRFTGPLIALPVVTVKYNFPNRYTAQGSAVLGDSKPTQKPNLPWCSRQGTVSWCFWTKPPASSSKYLPYLQWPMLLIYSSTL